MKASSFWRPRQTGSYKKEQHAGRVEIRNTPGADLMVDEVHTNYVDSPLLCYYIALHDRSIEGGALCKLRCRLMAAGGSLRFVCQHPTPQRIRSRGRPFRIAALNKKILARSIRAKRKRFETFGGQEIEYRKENGLALDQQIRI